MRVQAGVLKQRARVRSGQDFGRVLPGYRNAGETGQGQGTRQMCGFGDSPNDIRLIPRCTNRAVDAGRRV